MPASSRPWRRVILSRSAGRAPTDQGRYKEAASAFREYASHVRGPARLYLPLGEASRRVSSGNLDGALASYREAVTELAKAGQREGAEQALRALASNAMLLGQAADALAFARGQDLAGREYESIALLESWLGNQSAAESAISRYALALAQATGDRQTAPEVMEDFRTEYRVAGALARGDARPMLAGTSFPGGSFTRFARGRASLLLKDYPGAEKWFRGVLAWERQKLSFPGANGTVMPLLAALCHFYLGKAHQKAGQVEEAVLQYRQFLSRFETPPARLAEVAEARAALNCLVGDRQESGR